MSRNLRTSTTDPIQIPTLSAASGRIGISFCPGKQGPALAGFEWKRDLAADLDAVREWGAAAVVSLIEKHEIELLGVADLETAVAARGMEWFHLPIPDVTAPGEEFEQRWHQSGARLRSLLNNGESIFIHCRGGLGRAGTVAARLLIELGITGADTVIAKVRQVRPGAIETKAQEDHLRAIERIYDRSIGCLIGLAVGDALGTTLEFKPRDTYPHITDMVGGGPFGLDAGTWTDDTSMALALGEALLASAAKGSVFEPEEAQRIMRVARRQSMTTHAAEACLDACEAYALVLRAAIS